MPGTQEILILVVIIAAIFFLPRLMAKKPDGPVTLRPVKRLSGRMRLAIFVSILWPIALGLFLRPWQQGLILFLCVGILPVSLAWGIGWVVAGYRKDRW